MRNRAPTQEEFTAWLDHPATWALHNWLRLKREQCHSAWESGRLSNPDPMAWVAKNSEVLGVVGLCRELLEMEFEQLVTESSNEQSIRSNPNGPTGTRFAIPPG